MELNLFDLLCEELGYDRSTVLVIRVAPHEASVAYTEVSGMPRSTVHRFPQDVGGNAAGTARSAARRRGLSAAPSPAAAGSSDLRDAV
jgi:hypothetical protein